MTPTDQQLAIFDAVLNGDRHVLVEAGPGCGKTSTAVALAKQLPTSLSSIFLAFGTEIAAELDNRLPYWVQSMTTHVFGKRALEKHFGVFKMPVDYKKTWKIAKELIPEDCFWDYATFATKLVGLMKNTAWGLNGVHDVDTLFDLVNKFELYTDGDEETGVAYAESIFHESLLRTKAVDFDDMLYLPLHLGVELQKFHVVLIDEAQDFNTTQRLLCHRILYPDSKLVIVGDPRQAIFAFRGADSESIPKFIKEFDPVVLPLDRTFRCARAIVAEANTIYEKRDQSHTESGANLQEELQD